MSYEFKGKVIEMLPERTGVKSNGESWYSRTIVLEEQGERYAQRLCADVRHKELIENINLKIGDVVVVKFNVDAVRWKERYFPNLRIFSIAGVMGENNQPQQQAQYAQPQQQPVQYTQQPVQYAQPQGQSQSYREQAIAKGNVPSNGEDDLPF